MTFKVPFNTNYSMICMNLLESKRRVRSTVFQSPCLQIKLKCVHINVCMIVFYSRGLMLLHKVQTTEGTGNLHCDIVK